MQSILENVVGKPRDHIAHRRFARLADELSVAAWKVLTVIEQARPGKEGMSWLFETPMKILLRDTALEENELDEALEYLVLEQLADRRRFDERPRAPLFQHDSLLHFLSATGAAFLEYKRG